MNRPNFSRIRSVSAFATAALALATALLGAQEPRRTSTVSIWVDPAIATLMLVDSLPAPASATAGAVLIRRPGDAPKNIILVTEATSPRELSQAITALAFSRRNQGDTVGREMRTAIAAAPQKAGPATRDDQRAATDLRRLRLAPTLDIPGIARGPAIIVRMSPAATATSPATKSASPPPRRP